MSALPPKADIVGDAGQTRHQSKSHSFLIRPLCVHEAFFKAQSEDEPQLSKKAEFHKAGVVPRSKAEAGLSACPGLIVRQSLTCQKPPKIGGSLTRKVQIVFLI
jgi:hypothetical protein